MRGNFLRKADMFSKRTIKQKVTVQSVDTASEAYALSLSEKRESICRICHSSPAKPSRSCSRI